MSWLRSPYKIIVGNLHRLPQIFYPRYDAIHIFLGTYTLFFSYGLYLLSVFVCSRKKSHIISGQPFESCHCVSHYRTVRMSDVKIRAWIVNRCCNVVFTFSCCHFTNHSFQIIYIAGSFLSAYCISSSCL